MAESTTHAVFVEGARRSRWESFFLFATGALASTVLLKIASIQYLEILYLVQFAVLLIAFYRAQLKARLFRPLLTLGVMYGLVGLGMVLLALAALRFTFYVAADQQLLQMPIAVTISRLTELALDAGIMLYLANLFRQRPEAARFTMRAYYWTGAASVFYSMLSYPLDRAGIASLGAYGDLHRFRGFYNEGGPYGLYVITILGVGWALARLDWEPRRRTYFTMALMGIAFVMSQSKAAAVALLVLLLLRSLFAQSIRQRVTTIAIGAVFLIVVAQTLDLAAKIRLWQQAGQQYELVSHLHVGDANFVQGRVAGLFIVPRMIAAHPLTGIGWGNYGILRNDPQYRGAAAWGDPDEPGLGILGVAAETGLPLLTLLLLCLVLPYIWLRRLRVPECVANLALLQPVAHLFGAQLNLTYPWIVTAFALGVGYALSSRRNMTTQRREMAAA